MTPITLLIAGAAGVIVAAVTYRTLRHQGPFGQTALPIALAGAALAAIGIMNLGEDLLFLAIPWAALALTLPFVWLISLFRTGHTPDTPTPPPEPTKPDKKPKPKKKSDNKPNIPIKNAPYPLGALLPPTQHEDNLP